MYPYSGLPNKKTMAELKNIVRPYFSELPVNLKGKYSTLSKLLEKTPKSRRREILTKIYSHLYKNYIDKHKRMLLMQQVRRNNTPQPKRAKINGNSTKKVRENNSKNMYNRSVKKWKRNGAALGLLKSLNRNTAGLVLKQYNAK